MNIAADYVIVGAGSAGCVLADRLSEGGAQVVLLEAGPADRHPMIHIPAGILSLLHHPRLNWNYFSEPETESGNRPIHWPCLLYTSPSPRDRTRSRMPSSA